jgi:hypothetical protein
MPSRVAFTRFNSRHNEIGDRVRAVAAILP